VTCPLASSASCFGCPPESILRLLSRPAAVVFVYWRPAAAVVFVALMLVAPLSPAPQFQ